ncbi:MAG: hypothetical protein Q4D21_03830 [Phascolarctobacterium sp.]|nr:hypothetical protein [Phascolarctobacterium sp.]
MNSTKKSYVSSRLVKSVLASVVLGASVLAAPSAFAAEQVLTWDANSSESTAKYITAFDTLDGTSSTGDYGILNINYDINKTNAPNVTAVYGAYSTSTTDTMANNTVNINTVITGTMSIYGAHSEVVGPRDSDQYTDLVNNTINVNSSASGDMSGVTLVAGSINSKAPVQSGNTLNFNAWTGTLAAINPNNEDGKFATINMYLATTKDDGTGKLIIDEKIPDGTDTVVTLADTNVQSHLSGSTTLYIHNFTADMLGDDGKLTLIAGNNTKVYSIRFLAGGISDFTKDTNGSKNGGSDLGIKGAAVRNYATDKTEDNYALDIGNLFCYDNAGTDGGVYVEVNPTIVAGEFVDKGVVTYKGLADAGKLILGNDATSKSETALLITGKYAEAQNVSGGDFKIDAGGLTVASGAALYGGYSNAKSTSDAPISAESNKITIAGNLTTVASTNIIGGYAIGSNSLVASNTVEITAGTVGFADAPVVISNGVRGTNEASFNTVTISGGTVNASEIFGGFTQEADSSIGTTLQAANAVSNNAAFGNTVNLSNPNLTVAVNVYGGGGLFANSNTVNISAGSVTSTATGNAGYVRGGYAIYAAAGNTVNVTGGTLSRVIGGQATGNSGTQYKAMSNTVNFGGEATAATIYGGYVDATGYTATNNTVNITGGTITGEADDFTGVHGAYATGGTTSNNLVNITGGTITSTGNFVYVQGGKGSTNTNNIVAVSGSADITKAALRGGSDGSTCSGNVLYIGYAVTKDVDGNVNAVESNWKNNTVYNVANFSTINLYSTTYDDKATLDSSKGDTNLANTAVNVANFTFGDSNLYQFVSGNSAAAQQVNISYNGTDYSVASDSSTELGKEGRYNSDKTAIEVGALTAYNMAKTAGGIYAEYSSNVLTGNYLDKDITVGTEGILTLGDTVTESTASIVAGTYSDANNVIGGKVVITGDFTDTDTSADNKTTVIYGGYTNSANASTSGNTITVKGSAAGDASITQDPNLSSVDLIGAGGVTGATVSNENTLVINGWNGTINSISNFKTINFDDTVDSTVAKPVLNINGTPDLSNVDVVLNSTSTTLASGEEVVLLTGDAAKVGSFTISKDLLGNTYGDTGVNVSVEKLTDTSEAGVKISAKVLENTLTGTYIDAEGKTHTGATGDGSLQIGSDPYTTSGAGIVAGKFAEEGNANEGNVVITGTFTDLYTTGAAPEKQGETTKIYGGYVVDEEASSSGNTVTILGANSGDGTSGIQDALLNNVDLIGSNVNNENTLHIDGWSGTVNSISNFDTINIDNAVMGAAAPVLDITVDKIDWYNYVTVNLNSLNIIEELPEGTSLTLVQGNTNPAKEIQIAGETVEFGQTGIITEQNEKAVEVYDIKVDNNSQAIVAKIESLSLTGTYIGTDGKTVMGETGDGSLTLGNGGTTTTQASTVAGVMASSNDATDGKLTINSGFTGDKLENIAGGTTDKGNATGNEVTINGGVKASDVVGGNTSDGNATNNTVNINETVSAENLVGGATDKGNASDNTVNINAALGKVNVYGGSTDNGEATNNIINVNANVEGTITSASSKTGNASNNTVNINTDKVGSVVLGGTNDTLNINSTANISNLDMGAAGGNTLNIGSKNDDDSMNAASLTVGSLTNGNNQNYNFYVPSDYALNSGYTFLTVNGEANISGSNVNMYVAQLNEVRNDDVITLISADNLITDGVTWTRTLYGDLVDYDFTLAQEGSKYVARAKAQAKEDAKSPVESMLASAAMINQGSDMLSGLGFDAMSDAADSDNLNGQQETLGKAERDTHIFALAGASKMRYNSGSHIDNKGWNGILGLGYKENNASGSLTYGPVFEYGQGSYDSYLNNGVHGEGDTEYVGGGFMAKQVNNSGVYYEGSFRVGRNDIDYKGTFTNGSRASYDSDSTYMAAHLGMGYVTKVSDTRSLEYYGKLFYTHVKGDDVKLSDGTNYQFDDIDSTRLRVGLRMSKKYTNQGRFYYGLAYQYEFNSDADALVNGVGVNDAPSLKGSSGIGEIGYLFTSKNHYDIDLNGFGSVGKQRGIGAKLQFKWNF